MNICLDNVHCGLGIERFVPAYKMCYSFAILMGRSDMVLLSLIYLFISYSIYLLQIMSFSS